MKVAVLGAGPVGVVAAHTSQLYGHEPRIYGIRSKSRIAGAQYIHHPIPEMTPETPEATVTYLKRGTRDGYAEKVYGDPDADCSWDRFDGEVDAWNLAVHYSDMFDKYTRGMMDTEVRQPMILELLGEYDYVFSTFNPLGYCSYPQDHIFEFQQVRCSDLAAEDMKLDNTILYSGDPEDDFYRTSILFGDTATEYPETPRLKGKYRGREIRKPLYTDCDCLLEHENFVRIGRFGEFKKELLVTDAYDRVCETLDEM